MLDYSLLRKPGVEAMLLNVLPSIFAIEMANACGLSPDKDDQHIDQGYMDEKLLADKRLEQFQQMAITCKLKDCLSVYYSIDLNKKQKLALELIHKLTKPWLMGFVAGELLKVIGSSNMADKNTTFVQSATLLIKALVDEEAIDKEAGDRLTIRVMGAVKE